MIDYPPVGGGTDGLHFAGGPPALGVGPGPRAFSSLGARGPFLLVDDNSSLSAESWFFRVICCVSSTILQRWVIPMAIVHGRITVFFQEGEYGWTETLFNSAGSYLTLQLQANAYSAARQMLLCGGTPGFGPTIIGWRVSDDTVFRDAFVNFYQPPLAGLFTGTALHPTTALLMRLTATELSRRPLYLSGIPAEIMDANANYFPTPAWTVAINTFKTFITNGNWQVKGQLGPTEPAALALSGINAPNLFVTQNAYPFVAPADLGKVVRVRGRRINGNPVGLHRILNLTPPNGLTLAGVDLPADYHYSPPLSCSIQLQVAEYQTIQFCSDERLTERRRGRPFGLPRGRKSPVRAS